MIPDKAFYTVSYRMPYLFLPGIPNEKWKELPESQ